MNIGHDVTITRAYRLVVQNSKGEIVAFVDATGSHIDPVAGIGDLRAMILHLMGAAIKGDDACNLLRKMVTFREHPEDLDVGGLIASADQVLAIMP